MKTILGKKTDAFSLVVKLSDDKLKLYVDIEPLAGPVSITVDELKLFIGEAAPQADLHEEVLADIRKVLATGEKVLERRVAKGKPAEAGADGKLLLLVKPLGGKGEVQLDERGYARFEELNLFDNIEIGQQVARIYAPKLGHDGYEALGAKITGAAGKPVKVTLEKGLVKAPGPGNEYEVVVAQAAGYLKADGLRLALHEELRIQGDLDLKVGNINFIGSVKISGQVGAGLTVQARGDIEVEGAREAKLISSAGSIKVKGFLFGGERGRVTAQGDVFFSVVQHAHVECSGDISVEREALDCTFRSQGYVRLPRARFVGGHCYVVKAAEAKVWGNDAALRTQVYLTSNVEARAEYTAVMQQIVKHNQAIELVKLHLGPYAQNPLRVQRLNEPHKTKMSSLLSKLGEIQRSLGKIEQKRHELLSGAEGVEGLRLNIRQFLLPGVEVQAGEKKFQPQEPVLGPKSVLAPQEGEADFVIADFQPLPVVEKKEAKK